MVYFSIFLCRCLSPTLGGNARDYARWRFAGVFPVAKRQKEMRAQMRQQAHQSPNAHRRVLPAVVFCRSVVSISADK